MFYLKCIKCNAEYPPEERAYTCPKCGGLLEVVIELDKIHVPKEAMNYFCSAFADIFEDYYQMKRSKTSTRAQRTEA